MTGAEKRFCLQGATSPGLHDVFVPRPEVQEITKALELGNSVRIGGSRASGKTSAAQAVSRSLQAKGWRVTHIDLVIDVGLPKDPENWPDALIRAIWNDLGLDRALLPSSELTPEVRLSESLRIAANAASTPLLVILDEFDGLNRHPFLSRFIAVLRGLQNVRSRDQRSENLLMALVGVRPPEELVVGEQPAAHLPFASFWLDNYPWTDAVIEALSEGFPASNRSRLQLARMALEASGGHPWVCSWICNRIIERGLTAPEDLRYFVPAEVTYHKNHHGGLLFESVPIFLKAFEPRLQYQALQVYEQILNGQDTQREADRPDHALLQWSGLVRTDSSDLLRARGSFFEANFDQKWVNGRLLDLARDLPRSSRRGTQGRGANAKILVINTGGTIGMVEKDGKVVRAERDEELSALYEDLDAICQRVDFESFDPRDSANIGPPYWTRLAETILKRYRNYDGVVVAHGTDTMAYTASALSFAFGDRLPFSLVFTGAQTTVDRLHGDARSNLYRAVLVALERIPEVLVLFGEYAFRASRAQKKDDVRFDAFESPAAPPLAYVTEFVEVQHHALRTPVGGGKPLSSPFTRFSDGILQVAQCPGAFSSFYEACLDQVDSRGRRRCRGIVLQTLGAGNVPTEDPYSLKPLINSAKARHIPVLLTSQYPISGRDLTRYAPAAVAIETGALPIGNMTVAAVVAKLSWVLAQVDEDVDRGRLAEPERVAKVNEMMSFNYVGEVNAVSVSE